MSDEALTLLELAAYHARSSSDLVGLADLADGRQRVMLLESVAAHAQVSQALSAAASSSSSRTVEL